MYQDTIVAISTPIGEGGIGIVRISGNDACRIVTQFFTPELEDHRLVYGHITDPQTNEVVDEVLVSFMAAPRTYTREDIVEINCHSGHLPLQYILSLALRYGARLAQPGEFTLRAFLNGRIDLTQAESVIDIIQAKTQAGLRLAMQGLSGQLSGCVKAFRAELVDCLAYFTARIDFPDDEIEPREVTSQLIKIKSEITDLIFSADHGIVHRQGIRTAIVGRPNVGKSSLLNRLSRENRAIVTPIPGTTRDVIEETVNLGGVPFLLNDTAGITETEDTLELLAMERSRNTLDQADLILFLIDNSEPLTVADREIANILQKKQVLMIANKSDLPAQADLHEFSWETIVISSLTGAGLDDLESRMVAIALGGQIYSPDTLLISNPRHKDALQKAAGNLNKALQDITLNMADDFITIDLTAAINALDEITGGAVQEDLLESIFSQFCIGK